MPCVDCLDQQKVLIQLTGALHDREQKLQDLTGKFQRYRLQTKARFAQLRHQVLDNVQDAGYANKLSDMLLHLDATGDQLIFYKDQNDELKTALENAQKLASTQKSQIQELEYKLSARRVDSSSENGHVVQSKSLPAIVTQKSKDASSHSFDCKEQEQMYTQIMYKDTKILELTKLIDEKDQQIMDCQEAVKERDEVNKAKTKAIQILQEQLSPFINKKMCNKSTEIDPNSCTNLPQKSTELVSLPGGAVAFYKENPKKDDECSSFTTEMTNTEISTDFPKEPKGMVALNSRLSGLLEQVETMQRRVIKQDENFGKLVTESGSTSENTPSLKKKREKKVKFDFTEQERLAQIGDLEEKLQKSELACHDLLEENDELRVTIAEFEKKLDTTLDEKENFEQAHSNQKRQLELNELEMAKIHQQLDEVSREAKNSTLKAKAVSIARLKELEADLEQANLKLAEKGQNLEEASDVRSKLENEAEQFKTKVQALETEIDQVRPRLISCESALLEKDEQIIERARNETVLLSRLDTARFEFERFKSDTDKLIKEMDTDMNERSQEHEDEKSGFVSRIRDLETTLDENRHQMESLQLLNETTNRELTRLSDQNETLLKDLDQLKEAIEISNEFVDYLESDLCNTQAESEELRKQLEKKELLRETSEYRLKFKAYLAKLSNLQKENERLEEEAIKLKDELEKTKNDKLTFGTVSKSNFEQMTRLCDKSTRDTRLWSDKSVQMRVLLEDREAEIENLAARLKECEEQLGASRQLSESRLDECQHLKEQIDSLNEEKSEIEGELHKLWQADSASKRRLAEFEALSVAATEENTVVVKALDQERKQSDVLKDKLSQMELITLENMQLKEKIEMLKQHCTNPIMENDILAKLNESETNLIEVQVELSKTKKDLEDLNRDKSKLNRELSELQKALCDEREEKVDLLNRLEDANVKNRELEMVSVRLESEIQTATKLSSDEQTEKLATFSTLQSENFTLKDQVSNLEHVLQEKETELVNFGQKLEFVKEALERAQIEQSEKQSTLNQINSLRDANRALEEAYQKLEINFEWIQTDESVLKDRLQLAEKESNQRENALNTFKTMTESFSTLFSNKMDSFDKNYNGNVDMLSNSVQKALKKMTKLKNERQQQKSDAQIALMHFKGVVDELENELLDFKLSFKAKSVEIEELSAENAALQEKLDDLTEKLSLNEKEKDSLAEERQNLCQEIIELNAQVFKLADNEATSPMLKLDLRAQGVASISPMSSTTTDEALPLESAGGAGTLTPHAEGGQSTIFDPEMKAAVGASWESAYNQLAAYYTQLQQAYAAVYNELAALKGQMTTFGSGSGSSNRSSVVHSEEQYRQSMIDMMNEFSDFETRPLVADTVFGQLDQLKQLLRQTTEKNKSLFSQGQSLSHESAGYIQHISILTQEIDQCRKKLDDEKQHNRKMQTLLHDANTTESLLREEIDNLKVLCQKFDQEVSHLKNDANLGENIQFLNRMIETLEKSLIDKSAAMLDLERISKENQDVLEAQILSLLEKLNNQNQTGRFEHVEVQTTWEIEVETSKPDILPTSQSDKVGNNPDIVNLKDEVSILKQALEDLNLEKRETESFWAVSCQDLQKQCEKLEQSTVNLQNDVTKSKLLTFDLFELIDSCPEDESDDVTLSGHLENLYSCLKLAKNETGQITKEKSRKSDENAWGEFEFEEEPIELKTVELSSLNPAEIRIQDTLNPIEKLASDLHNLVSSKTQEFESSLELLVVKTKTLESNFTPIKSLAEYAKLNRILREENDQLKLQYSRLQADFSNLCDRVEATECSMMQLNSLNDQLLREKRGIEGQSLKLHEDFDYCKKELQQSQSNNQELLAKLENYKTEVAATTNEANSLILKLQNFKSITFENEKLQKENDDLNGQIETLHGQMDQWKIGESERSKSMSNLNGQIDTLTLELDQTKLLLQMRNEEFLNLSRQSENLSASHDLMSEQLKMLESVGILPEDLKIEATVKVLSDENRDLRAKVDDLGNLRDQYEQAMIEKEQLKIRISEFERKSPRLQPEHISVQCELLIDDDGILKKENELLLKRIGDFETKFVDNNSKLAGISDFLTQSEIVHQIENEKTKLEAKLVKVVEENRQLNDGTKKVSDEFEKVKIEYKRRITEMTEEVKAMTEENTRLVSAAKEKDAECVKHAKNIKAMKVELIEKRKICSSLKSAADDLALAREQAQKLSDELDRTKSTLAECQNERHTLQLTLQESRKQGSANSKISDQMRKASSEAKELIKALETERATHSKSAHELGELREQLAHSERQLDVCRIKLLEQEKNRDRVQQLENRLDTIIADNEKLSRQLSESEKRWKHSKDTKSALECEKCRGTSISPVPKSPKKLNIPSSAQLLQVSNGKKGVAVEKFSSGEEMRKSAMESGTKNLRSEPQEQRPATSASVDLTTFPTNGDSSVRRRQCRLR